MGTPQRPNPPNSKKSPFLTPLIAYSAVLTILLEVLQYLQIVLNILLNMIVFGKFNINYVTSKLLFSLHS